LSLGDDNVVVVIIIIIIVVFVAAVVVVVIAAVVNNYVVAFVLAIAVENLSQRFLKIPLFHVCCWCCLLPQNKR